MIPLSVWIVAICLLSSAVSLGIAVYACLKAERPRLIALESAVRDYRMETEALANSYNSVRESVKRINSRYAMREKRAADAKTSGGADPDLPDPATDPDGWRAAIQRKYPQGVFSIGKVNGR